MKIFDDTLSRVERSLDVRLLRQGVLAGNIANIDTPGYKPKDVDFSVSMNEALGAASDLQRTDEGHLDAGGGSVGQQLAGGAQNNLAGARVVETRGTAPSLDGNEVDLDKTMAAMAENGIQYSADARAAMKKLAILRYVTSDGNG